uniref:Lon proteolytic domain-containing protein n=1 Tax=Brassica campestris TaxID=3711 RepID=M4FHE4_BRACM
MDAELESSPAVHPSLQYPLTIVIRVAGKKVYLEVPSVVFDAKPLAISDSEFLKYFKDSKVHFINAQGQIDVSEADKTVMFKAINLASYVGKQVLYEQTPIGFAIGLAKWYVEGQATAFIDGLAWYVKTMLVEESEEDICSINVIGQVGMETYESACIAYEAAQRILLRKQPGNTFFTNSKVYVYMPTSDGASAGCTICTSLLSLAMNKSVRKNLAMSGEITPTGEILQIGHVKDKTMGARRSQLKTIIYPEANRREFDELPENLKDGLDVHFVDEYEQIFELAFN